MRKIIYIILFFILFSTLVDAKCRINVTVELEKNIIQNFGDTIKIYSIEKPFPMVFTDIKKLSEFEKISADTFQFDVDNNDTIVTVELFPFNEGFSVLIKNENQININVKISSKGIKTNLGDNDPSVIYRKIFYHITICIFYKSFSHFCITT